jgi:hypothetical protein
VLAGLLPLLLRTAAAEQPQRARHVWTGSLMACTWCVMYRPRVATAHRGATNPTARAGGECREPLTEPAQHAELAPVE